MSVGSGASSRRWGAAAAVLVVILTAPTAGASSSTGTTLAITAGTGAFAAVVPGPALGSPLYYPRTLASDGSGNVYVAFGVGSTDQHSVAELSAAGVISYLVNSARAYGPPAAGLASSSALGTVSGVAADLAGNVYVGDSEFNRVVKVDTSGQLSIFAGDGTAGVTVAGTATAVPLTPGVLGSGPDGSVFVFTASKRVVKVNASGQLTIVAGNGAYGTPTPGTAGSPVAALASPLTTVSGLAADSGGNLFISYQNSDCVTMVDPSGWLTTVAGLCGTSGAAVAGPALASRLNGPRQVAVDRHNDLYIVDKQNMRVEKVTSPASGAGTLSFIAGNGTGGGLLAGPALNSPLSRVTGIAVDRSSNVYLAEGDQTHLGKIAGVPSAPDAPTGLTATGGRGSVALSFWPPADDGGSSITSYDVSADLGTTWHALAASGTSPLTATLPGLASGTSYTLTVRAVNSVGSGPASGTASARTASDPVASTPTSSPTSTPTPSPTPTGSPTPSPTSTPSPTGTPRPPAATGGLIPIPANPRAYRGPKRFTQALNRSFTGVAATPVAKLRARLQARQAAVLSDKAMFAGESARLSARGRAQVKRLAGLLKRGSTVRCEGYTDYSGQPAHLKSLSRSRARAVCAALVAYGARVRYTTAGYGGEHPVVVGGTPNDRAANRRVVVVIIT